MTSASELFHNRRSRFGRNLPELGFGGSSSSSFSFDRPLPSSQTSHNHNHHQHQHQHGRRPSRHHHHHSSDRNRRGSRHLHYQEHESVQVDHAAINPGNSSVGGGTSSRINRMQSVRSERLPGDVLLARERLVERLRSISLSSPSDREQRPRSALGVPSNDLSHNNEYRLIDARIWESGPTLAWIAGLYPYSYPTSQTSVFSSSQDSSTTRPRGLSLAEADSLHREVVVTIDEGETSTVEPVQECSICLDSFSEGEELICLPCEHKFHSACLYPWIRTCGDCPNCRSGIITYKE